VSVLHEVVGELARKSLAIARTRPTGPAFAPPMRRFYITTKPTVDLLNWLGNLVCGPPASRRPAKPATPPTTRTSCASWSGRAARRALMAPTEHEFTDNVFTFGDRASPPTAKKRAEHHPRRVGRGPGLRSA
jgi:CBS domain containing-hemolysin-like protein